MRINRITLSGILLNACLLLAACGGGGDSSPVISGSSSSSATSSSSSSVSSSSSSSSSAVTLKSLTATLGFPFGVAVGGPGDSDNIFATVNAQMQPVVSSQFDLVVPGNIMKMSYLEPTQNNFTFTNADDLVIWAQDNNMLVHGHTLIWYSAYQVPSFMNSFAGTPSQWNDILTNHVQTIVSHFATNFPGEVVSWDVVNEAIDDNITAGWRQSLFYVNSGNSSVYIENAFKTARAADPSAKLFYNDYNMESSTTKLNFMLTMVDDFQSRSTPIPIDGIGFQMHVTLTYPDINTIKNAFQQVVNRGLLVRISEFDIAVNNNNTLTANSSTSLTTVDSTTATAQKQRYHDIVQAYLDTVPMAQRGGITVWGLLDNYSWLNNPSATPPHYDWPLLFNSDYTTKPAFDGVAQALQGM